MPDGSTPLLTASEAADLLRMSRRTLYALLKGGEIPGAKQIGGVWRVNRATLLRWLSSQDEAGGDHA